MPLSADVPNYLTVQEAAGLLRVHPRTIRNWIREGRLPAKKIIGSRKVLLIDERDVLARLEDARPEDAEPEDTEEKT